MTATATGWTLGIDVGTSSTVAAYLVGAGGDSRQWHTRVLRLDGDEGMSSATYLDPSGTWQVGAAALSLGLNDLPRFIASPKRAVGLGQVRVGGEPRDVTEPLAAILSHVLGRAGELGLDGGAPPAAIVLTHPVSWRGARLRRLEQAALRGVATMPGWPAPRLLPEPVAAAHSLTDLADRARIAVLDIGGGTCDICVVERTGDEVRVVGSPLWGIDPLGGDDVDSALAQYALTEHDDAELTRRLSDPDDEDLYLLWELRASARRAKHAMSSSSSAVIRVPRLPGQSGPPAGVRVTREQLDRLVRGTQGQAGLDAAVTMLHDAIDEVGTVDGVLLVGGSSRLRVLGTLVQDATGLRPMVAGEPTTLVAEGAAAAAARAVRTTRPVRIPSRPVQIPPRPVEVPPQPVEVPPRPDQAQQTPPVHYPPTAQTSGPQVVQQQPQPVQAQPHGAPPWAPPAAMASSQPPPGEHRPPAASSPAPHRTRPAQPPRGVQSAVVRWVIVGAAIVLGVVAVWFAVSQLGKGGQNEAGETPTVDVGETPTEDPTTTTSTQETTPDPTNTSGKDSTATPVTGVTCWDGSPSTSVADCPLPEGEEGLFWLFAIGEPECQGWPTPEEDEAAGLVDLVICGADQADKTWYERWSSVEAMEAHYEKFRAERSGLVWVTGTLTLDGEEVGHYWESEPQGEVLAKGLYHFTGYPYTVYAERGDPRELAALPGRFELLGASFGAEGA